MGTSKEASLFAALPPTLVGSTTDINTPPAVSDGFSVYNNLVGRKTLRDHPLPELLPDDHNHGWHVARNLLKPLNHLQFLQRKEAIAITLNLHNTYTQPDLFECNYQLLAKHQSRLTSVNEVITTITSQLRASGRSVSEDDVRTLLSEYSTIRHMEFHPTDVCNLRCRGCTYGHDDPLRKPLPINFPFDSIKRIAALRPSSMVLIGGDEPILPRPVHQASFSRDG